MQTQNVHGPRRSECNVMRSCWCSVMPPALSGTCARMADMTPSASMPVRFGGGVRDAAPALPASQAPCLPPYLQQDGLLDLDQALSCWLAYRAGPWQQADVRIGRLVGDNGTWYWTLDILIPIPGQPGLQVRGLAHSVGRLPGASAFHPAACSNVVPQSVEQRSQTEPRRMAQTGHPEEPEPKRRMGAGKGKGGVKDRSTISNSMVVAPMPPPPLPQHRNI